MPSTTKAATGQRSPSKAKVTVKPLAKAKPKAVSKAAGKATAEAKPKAAPAGRNVKKFHAPQSQDFTISDNSGVIGQVRIKPNAVAWKPKRGKLFHQISLEQLANFAAEHGREVKN